MAGASRTTYHHGALRATLVRAGLELSRVAGADAIVLREATRRAGVSARAAYRHFADREALVQAVADEALAAMAAAMGRRQAGAATAVDRLRGVGEGYIEFALDEPGWFDVAVLAMPDLLSGPLPATALSAGALSAGALSASALSGGALERSPCGLLLDALGGLVAAGALPADELVDAAVTCWSGVHGFAMLTRGPLRGSPRALVDAHAGRFVATLVAAVAHAARGTVGAIME